MIGEIGRQLKAVMQDFEQRHWETRKVFLKRFREICEMLDLSSWKASAISGSR